MKSFTTTFALATLLVAPTIAAAQGTGTTGHVYAIDAQNGSGERGTFALKPHGERTTVEVHLLRATGTLQPAHLHMGTCAKLDPVPKYPLKSLDNGISETSIDVPMAKLVAMGLALNVHQSANNLKRYVACGNISS